MGVSIDPVKKVRSTPKEVAEGYALSYWRHCEIPQSVGYTYSNWKRVLDALGLGETHVTVGTMPVVMLGIHLDRNARGLADIHGGPRYLVQLRALVQACEEKGYSHIGWA